MLQLAVDRTHSGRTARLGAALGLLSGVLAGVAALIRPAMLLYLPLALVWLLLRRRPVLAVAMIAAATVVITPWTLRNVRVYDRFVLIASEGGVTFWTGNHALARGEGDLAANPDLKQAELAFRGAHPGLSPEALEPLYYRDAFDWIAGHPFDWLQLLVRKAFYSVVPVGPSYAVHSARYRVASVAPYLLVLPFAAVGARRLWSSSPAAGVAAAPRRVIDSCRPRVPATGTVPHAGYRSRADCFCRRAGGWPVWTSPIVSTPPTILVVVPTYNERDNLPVLARAVLAHGGYRMLVVDDGSPDGTGAVADALADEYAGRVEVMHRTGPRGLGRSYIDGLQKAIAQPDVDLVCQMDADLSHDPEYLPALVAATADHDVVIGSRYLNGVSVVNWPLHRHLSQRLREPLYPDRDEPDAARLHERLPVLEARVARAPAAGSHGFRRLRLPGGDALRSQPAGLPHRRSADHFRRAATGPVQGVGFCSLRVHDHSLAAALPQITVTRHVVVMVTSSYPRFPGDSVGTFMEPIATSVAARGHEVHVVAPWHPLVTRAR